MDLKQEKWLSDFMSDSEEKKHMSFHIVYANLWFQLYIK